jgi:hypothetical protein
MSKYCAPHTAANPARMGVSSRTRLLWSDVPQRISNAGSNRNLPLRQGEDCATARGRNSPPAVSLFVVPQTHETFRQRKLHKQQRRLLLQPCHRGPHRIQVLLLQMFLPSVLLLDLKRHVQGMQGRRHCTWSGCNVWCERYAEHETDEGDP